MTYKDMVAQIAEKLSLPKGLVDRTYRAYWRAIKEHISSMPLREGVTDEEFEKLQPNVNIPSIGKLTISLRRYRKLQEIQKEKDKQKEDNYATCNKD